MPPVSNPPTLSSIIAEFGSGGSPNNLGSYYRGGPYVPDNSTTQNIATSSSLLKLSQFPGATKNVTTVELATRAWSAEQYYGNTATAGISLDTIGNATYHANGGSHTVHGNEWLRNGTASNYDVYAQLMAGWSGAFYNSSPFLQWLNLGTARGWNIQATNQLIDVQLRLHIGNAGTGSFFLWADIYLSAYSYSGPPA